MRFAEYLSKLFLLPQVIILLLLCLSVYAGHENNEIENTLQSADRLKRADSYEKALIEYQKAGSLAVKLNSDLLAAKSLLGQGEVYYLQTKFVHAVTALKKSVELAEKSNDKLTQAWANNWLGYVYYRLYYYDSSEFYLNKALELFNGLHDQAGQAIVLSNLARMIGSQAFKAPKEFYSQICTISGNSSLCRQPVEPIDQIHLEAIALARNSGNKEAISYCLNNYGNHVVNVGSKTEALKIFIEAYQLAQNVGVKRRIIITQGNVARTYLYFYLADFNKHPDRKPSEKIEQEFLNPAKENFQQAISLAQEINSDEELLELYSNSAIAFGIGDYKIWKEYFHKTIDQIEKMNQSDDGDEISRMRYFNGRTAPYENLIHYYAIDAKDYLAALQLDDRTKGRTLLELLKRKENGETDFLSQIQSNKQLIEIQNQLTSLNTEKLNEEKKTSPNKVRLTELENQIERLRQNKLDVQSQITTAKPSDSRTRTVPTLTKADIEKLLPDNQTAILVYLSMFDLVVITRGNENDNNQKNSELKMDNFPLFSQKEYDNNFAREEIVNINNFKEKIQNQDIDYKGLGKSLYHRFIKPADSVLKGKTKLLIVPDNLYLWSLPFAALITPENKHLVENFTISYSPSLSFLRESQNRKSIENNSELKNKILAIGDPSFNGQTITLAKTRFRARDISQLPESKREIFQSLKFYPKGQNSIYTGQSATEELFKKEAEKYRILHLATHGFADYSNPLFSALILADNSQDSDGLLEAWEVMQMNLKADLVILSACETANGRTFQGEGLTGLSWAFLIAGVPTVIASQWKVDSDATADLMIEFHRQLTQSNLSPAAALRSSQRKLLQNNLTKHPFYWASFAAIGKN